MWFVLIGLVVTLVSLFNEFTGDGETSFLLFIIVGIGFIIYGSGKLILNKSKEPKKIQPKKDSSKDMFNNQTDNPNSTAQKYQSQSQIQQQQKILLCKMCGNRIRIQDNFCSHCGAQLKNFH